MTAPEPWPVTRDLEAEARGWRSAANDLASFADARLVIRRDVWGGYWPEPLRATLGKLRTAPTKARRGLEYLEVSVLRRHFIGADVGDVIGLHATGPEGVSRWCALDFDAHGDVTDAQRTQLRDAALWCVEVMGERLSVLLEDSDGNGGFHVWAHFDAPVATPALYAWLQRLATQCYAATDVKPETYPKQAAIAPDGFGSWLRLPGRHHTRAHWSRVCRPGEPWTSGADAARTILEHWPASPADAIPPLDAWPVPVVERSPAAPRQMVRSLADTPRDRAAVIAAYVNKLPHGEAGTERSTKLFNLARFLRLGMRCSEGEALPILHAWDAGNCPPLGADKIATTWANAARYASRPVLLQSREGARYAA